MLRFVARTPHQVTAGWMTRVQAASYLEMSAGAFLRLVKDTGVRFRLEKSVYVYHQRDIEELARLRDD